MAQNATHFFIAPQNCSYIAGTLGAIGFELVGKIKQNK
jgi:hypothetical protein